VISDDAVRHMAHYLGNRGTDLDIDVDGMVKEVPSAKGRYEREVAQMQRFVETLPPGTNPITSKTWRSVTTVRVRIETGFLPLADIPVGAKA
jgi:hypothetical protein